MAKNKMEDNNNSVENIVIDDSAELPLKEVTSKVNTNIDRSTTIKQKTNLENSKQDILINCLRKERIIIRHIPRINGIWGTDPKHILSGGMAETAVRTFTVPRLSSGMFVNVLTDSEKAFLEDVMGLEFNALSIYKKINNFWDDSNEAGINRVRLTKQDNYLDLSNPEDYIRYKILLANKDFIAPSIQALEDHPKATYQYVIISEGEETKVAKKNMSTTMMCYKEFGKIEEDKDTLRVIVETIEGKPTSSNTKIEFLQTRINQLIQTDSKLFLKVISDPLLSTKVLIKKCIEEGLIANRSNLLYLREDMSPLCENGEESTINIAAKYLNSPKHQDLLFSLQAKLK